MDTTKNHTDAGLNRNLSDVQRGKFLKQKALEECKPPLEFEEKKKQRMREQRRLKPLLMSQEVPVKQDLENRPETEDSHAAV